MNDPQKPESGAPSEGTTPNPSTPEATTPETPAPAPAQDAAPTPTSPFASPDPAGAQRPASPESQAAAAPTAGNVPTSDAVPTAQDATAEVPAQAAPHTPFAPYAPEASAAPYAASAPQAAPSPYAPPGPQVAAAPYAASAPAPAPENGTTGTTTVAPAPVGRLRGRVVAAIAAGALILGGAAGYGGAALYNSTNGDSSVASTLPSSAEGSTTSTSNTVSSDIDVVSIAAAVTDSVVVLEVVRNGQVVSTGSGFFIREDGYILTNAHVVADAGGTVTVVKSDGSETEGTVVGSSTEYDLAVVHIDETGLTPLVLADSDDVVVGEGVVAIGSPLGLESTVTTGIVSALHRPVTTADSSSTAFVDAIQTDAAINPGNSGGPLLNADGEVIGINSAIATLSTTTDSTGSIGLGFAITSNQARRTAEEIIATGVATYPVIGVMLDSSYTGRGVQVVDSAEGVVAGGPADQAGIQPGDVITAIDGRPVTQSDELVVAIRAKAPGDDVTLTIQSGDSSEDVVVTLSSNSDVVFSDQSEGDENPLPTPGDE
ncbi:S1C family serine protease [Demequina zhanjiangensis]|uniref:Trypsin-like peptidase domain-containing protein n=1 Tax=Demequina zhanjiangensis TaxID=3051659 RepID=A0ABT8G1H1_9MICO|nr:trypsin-like peptidase domain-containing protein [Demequina sp. SYSU T00b26]MDN4472809.1 trypsin-like peptidase domain-containing protein [Demequina sp. SYSU T00b26]